MSSAEYALARKRALAKRKPKATAPNLPASLERKYLQIATRFSRKVQALVVSRLHALAPGVRADSYTGRVDGVNDDWDDLEGEVYRLADDMAPELFGLSKQLDRFSRLEMARAMNLALRDDPRIAMYSQHFVRKNVGLIKSASGEQLVKMRQIVDGAIGQGLSAGALKKQLIERCGVLESRASLIATDQTLKANADLNRFRQEAVGVKRYVWSTSQDERVRHDHAILNGRTFSYDDPPVVDQRTGARENPGRYYRCRCLAIPVTDDLLFGP